MLQCAYYSKGKSCISFHLIIGNSQHQVKAQWLEIISKGAFSFKSVFPHAMKENLNENKKTWMDEYKNAPSKNISTHCGILCTRIDH